MDIGGGSVEFIIANADGLLWYKSFPIGVAILYNRFQKSDPMREVEREGMEKFIVKELTTLIDAMQSYAITEMIGASGSFEVLEALCETKEDDGQTLIATDEVIVLFHRLLPSNEQERLQIKALPKDRVRLIVSALVLIHQILDLFPKIQVIRMSEYALKEGVIYNSLG